MPTPSPHDTLFRQVFSDPRHAAAQLRAVLPDDLVAVTDWTSLEVVDGSFADFELAAGHCDVLYRVRIGGAPTMVHLILEHKSTADRWTVFQVFGYAVHILRSWTRANPDAERLPAVIAVVVHHSRDGWQGPDDLQELIDLDPELRAILANYLPRFRVLVDDLSRVEEADLMRRTESALLQLAWLCLKRVRDATDPAAELRRLRGLLASARVEPGARGLLISVLTYVAQVWRLDAEEFRTLARLELGDAMSNDEIPTIYEQLVSKGRAEGRAESREAEIAILLEQLEARFGACPEAVRERVRRASDEERRAWARRLVRVETLDAVFDVRV